MKILKYIIGFVVGFLVSAIIVGGICTYFWRIKYVGEFDVNHYSEEIERFPSDLVLGPVRSKREAQKKALAVFMDMRGGKFRLTERPLGVLYDDENGMWLIMSRLPPNSFGGVYCLIIRESDGKVIARWRY